MQIIHRTICESKFEIEAVDRKPNLERRSPARAIWKNETDSQSPGESCCVRQITPWPSGVLESRRCQKSFSSPNTRQNESASSAGWVCATTPIIQLLATRSFFFKFFFVIASLAEMAMSGGCECACLCVLLELVVAECFQLYSHPIRCEAMPFHHVSTLIASLFDISGRIQNNVDVQSAKRCRFPIICLDTPMRWWPWRCKVFIFISSLITAKARASALGENQLRE